MLLIFSGGNTFKSHLLYTLYKGRYPFLRLSFGCLKMIRIWIKQTLLSQGKISKGNLWGQKEKKQLSVTWGPLLCVWSQVLVSYFLTYSLCEPSGYFKTHTVSMQRRQLLGYAKHSAEEVLWGQSHLETCRVKNSGDFTFIPFLSCCSLPLPSSLEHLLIASYYVQVPGDIELKAVMPALEEFTVCWRVPAGQLGWIFVQGAVRGWEGAPLARLGTSVEGGMILEGSLEDWGGVRQTDTEGRVTSASSFWFGWSVVGLVNISVPGLETTEPKGSHVQRSRGRRQYSGNSWLFSLVKTQHVSEWMILDEMELRENETKENCPIRMKQIWQDLDNCLVSVMAI